MSDQATPTTLRTADPRTWPEYLTADDVAAILGCSKRTAQRHISAGSCGAYFHLGGVRFVRREVFRRALQGREIRPSHRA